MARFVVRFDEIDRTDIARVGGKGANLGELARLNVAPVPPGFCVTTDAFRRALAEAPSLDEQLDRLARLAPDDRSGISALSADIRRTIEAIPLPGDLQAEIAEALGRVGADETAAWAVRSSATAEDLPTASFAGQQDTYLNVIGLAAVQRAISRCWGSLFTERAVTYRLRQGIDQREHGVSMGVVVQRLVVPEASGVLFTADPVTGNRRLATVEASFGLGEALVSGLVSPDTYTVRGDTIVASTVAAKTRVIEAVAGGGTREGAIEPARQRQPALTEAQVGRLVRLGRRIEAHFGRPQDIEWCLAGDEFWIVQSRPITTLFPIPVNEDQTFANHVYVSVGHQQMMTDAMKPLGISMWQLSAGRPMYEAGARLFVDVTREVAAPTSRATLVGMLGRSDPLITDALQTLLDRGDFIEERPDPAPGAASPGGHAWSSGALPTDPAIVAELIARAEAGVAALAHEIRAVSGPAVFDFIVARRQALHRQNFDPRSLQAIMAGLEATWWLNEHIETWLGEKNAADILTQSAPNNVTSEMGLALLDVADAVRPHPAVVARLAEIAAAGAEASPDAAWLETLPGLPGGREAHAAIAAFLDRYGVRCVGEIDITRPRWRERPAELVPLLLGNIANFAPGEGARRFEQGLQAATRKAAELLARLRTLPDGDQKADETQRMIDRVRTFIGYREYPKYALISRFFLYRQALLAEADRLVQAGVLHAREDIDYLRFEELHEAVRTHRVDHRLIRERREVFRAHAALTPPRVLTSDGEGLSGAYRRDDAPPGALIGLPVSAGTVEGRARVVLDIATADLQPGDILVTTYTDPSWTPLFVTIGGMVTEVGGLMTHGAVIAREYGLPTVVGVAEATRLIRDGQRIRLNGADGYVELLD